MPSIDAQSTFRVDLSLKTVQGAALCALILAQQASADASHDLREIAQFRRPVAACALDKELIVVANSRSGSVSVVDTETWSVTVERQIGERLSDVAALPDGRHVLATDEQEHAVLLLGVEAGKIWEIGRVPVANHPVSIAVMPDGRSAAVASLWSRTLTLLDVAASAGDDEPPQISVRATIPFPFPPRVQCALPDGRHLIVADAFQARLAVVNVESAELKFVRSFAGHNIRGMAVAPDGRDLYVTHQLLNSAAPTTFDSIHWGNLLENLIRVLPMKAVLDPETDLVRAGRSILLGTTGSGAGDPGGVAFTDDDRLIAVASGVDKAALFPELHSVVTPWIETGRRPTEVLVVAGGATAITVNMLDDSLTVIDVSERTLERDVSLGPTPDPGPRERGESLFFDARLSHDRWLSCHSCHTDGHTTGLLADTQGDGSYGSPKRILSLLGTRDNNPWAWNGGFRTLHDQVGNSVTTSMHGEALAPEQIGDVVAYLHTLEAPPPLIPEPTSEDDARLLEQGRTVFHAEGCARCHVPPLTYTSDQIVDVGLEDEQGARKFNPPSLRGVSQNERLLHDGRVDSLEALFRDEGHQLETGLSDDDVAALVRFLRSL
ncbi:MAG: hypothetical protein DWQ34_13610 [Planctomycetota bacterium]|nr:MAG: hypothetical protein DWQ29_09050 [Planctomycetota bacterium]REJ91948.1 MAG: hypothetical protein DWQ34_13610 [Planctomycetota bacterium]REK27265.1 MAG: hypothetical protein DWQ41_07805 [Planctomycetota bacterium]REK36714.1 MAG: hypothetical protein DWQ45_08830 [Planctomycetota bacterium]